MTDGTNERPTNSGGFATPQPANPPQFPNQPQFPNPSQFPNPPQFPNQPSFPPPPNFSNPPGFSTPGSPGSGFPPPNSGYSVAPVQRKKGRWWKILLIIVALMVLLIGGCTAFLVKSFKGVTDHGNKFLGALYISADSAVPLACPGTDRAELDEVRSGLLASGWTGARRLSSVSTNTTNGRSTGSVSGTVTLASGPQPITLVMRKDPKWCVSTALVGTDSVSSTNSSTEGTTETTKLR